VLTVAVSLAAGAASLASVFPSLRHGLLAMCLIGLAGIAAVNLWGIAESARFLMAPMAAFLCAIFGVIVAGLLRSHPAAVAGTAEPVGVSEALGVILILKAFAAGCSALTGIEAIANGVPAFRTSGGCSWRPSCAPAPTSSSASSLTGSPAGDGMTSGPGRVRAVEPGVPWFASVSAAWASREPADGNLPASREDPLWSLTRRR